MDWIKVTPETMPVDLETVIVNVKLKNGENRVYHEARWNKKKNQWEMLDLSFEDWWRTNLNITHWFPYPESPET